MREWTNGVMFFVYRHVVWSSIVHICNCCFYSQLYQFNISQTLYLFSVSSWEKNNNFAAFTRRCYFLYLLWKKNDLTVELLFIIIYFLGPRDLFAV